MKIKNLRAADLEKVEQLRTAQLLSYSRLKADGGEESVNYEGKTFLIGPDIFWPGEDSKALVRNFRILRGETVLDIGTGSGVLAIFAAAAGAAKVVGLEINEAAVVLARKNAAVHGFGDRIDIRHSDMFGALCEDEQFDVIVANPQ